MSYGRSHTAQGHPRDDAALNDAVSCRNHRVSLSICMQATGLNA